ncbi:MAG: DUF6443 domain-containing protein [Bacteroidota bacterium]
MKYLLCLSVVLLLSSHVSAFQVDPGSNLSSRKVVSKDVIHKDVVGDSPSLQELIDLPLAGSVSPKKAQPSSSHNYIMSSTYREASQQEASGAVSSPVLASQISYLDGLGREIQQVAVGISPDGKDVITPLVYDALGRMSHVYLPFAASSSGSGNSSGAAVGGFQENALAKQQAFYLSQSQISGSKSFPFSVSQFEASPLGRIIEQGAVGEAWQPEMGSPGVRTGEEHTVVNTYLTNESPVGGIAPNRLGWNSEYYPAGSLFINQTFDEHGALSESASDKLGRLVYVKKEVEEGVFAITHYCYDAFGNVRFVIQPEGMKMIQSGTIDSGVINSGSPFMEVIEAFGFQYLYDQRKRVKKKKVPAAGWVSFVYDKLDRVVATQDGKMEAEKKWLVSKYDRLGRMIKTGFLHSDINREQLQLLVDLEEKVYEVREGDDYANEVLPRIDEPLSIIFYDGYEFLGSEHGSGMNTKFDFREGEAFGFLASHPNRAETYKRAALNRGRICGIRTFVLEGNSGENNADDIPVSLLRVTYYDQKGREIQSVAENHLGGVDVLANRYAFSGELLESVLLHQAGVQKQEKGVVRVHKAFSYDHAGRLMRSIQQINDQKPLILAEHGYDSLGQLIEKDMGVNVGGNGKLAELQSVDYRYNLRGWMTDINQTGSVHVGMSSPGRGIGDFNEDLFGMELSYDESGNNGNKPLFNGNISAMSWQVVGREGKGSAVRGYDFSYDLLSRLKEADFSGGKDEEFSVPQISYDLNGNIRALHRMGQTGRKNGLPIFGMMDELDYSYAGE